MWYLKEILKSFTLFRIAFVLCMHVNLWWYFNDFFLHIKFIFWLACIYGKAYVILMLYSVELLILIHLISKNIYGCCYLFRATPNEISRANWFNFPFHWRWSLFCHLSFGGPWFCAFIYKYIYLTEIIILGNIVKVFG